MLNSLLIIGSLCTHHFCKVWLRWSRGLHVVAQNVKNLWTMDTKWWHQLTGTFGQGERKRLHSFTLGSNVTVPGTQQTTLMLFTNLQNLKSSSWKQELHVRHNLFQTAKSIHTQIGRYDSLRWSLHFVVELYLITLITFPRLGACHLFNKYKRS